MPTTVEVTLHIADPESVLLQGIHANVCRWLDTSATHRSNAKPFAVTPLLYGDGELRSFHVKLLDDSLLDRLRRSIEHEQASILRFGTSRAHLASDAMRVVRHLSFESLAELGSASPYRQWDVDVLTPLLMRSGDRDLVFPLPGSVLRSLHRQWLAWAPPTPVVPADFGKLPRLHVLEFDGSSAPVDVRGRTRLGFVGAVRFGLEKSTPENDRAAVNSLMEFSGFAGIGSMTTFGLGVVSVTGISAG